MKRLFIALSVLVAITISATRAESAHFCKEHKEKREIQILRQQNLSRWHIPPANYSGITSLGGDRYAVVDDKSLLDGFHIFNIKLNSRTGKVKNVSRTPLFANPYGTSKADCEDIAYVTMEDSEEQVLFIAQEHLCAVPEYHIDGHPTGRALHLPPYFSLAFMQQNAGFESLAYDTVNHTFYLTTEQPLKGDSIHHIVCFDSTLYVSRTINYQTDAPELKRNAKYYAKGISAMSVLPCGTLLILERELSIPRHFIGGKCRVKIYAINPTATDTITSKKLIAVFTTHIGRLNYANYEGMCLGPILDDGRRTLILINDSQGGVNNGPFKLKDYIKVIILNRELFP